MQGKGETLDGVVTKTLQLLISDFRLNLGDPTFCSDLYDAVIRKDVGRIREVMQQEVLEVEPVRYKYRYQALSFLKRHRYQNDIYSDRELEEKAIQLFLDTQNRIRDLDLDTLDKHSSNVLEIARVYVADVLGPYDDEECRSLCKFGKRASVGIPSRKACEAERWQVPLTGSLNQIIWFHKEIYGAEPVMNYLRAQIDSDPEGSIYQEIESLKLTLVPKTFKALRVIMPNTTIGSYMSYGIGEMIRKRLKRKGYDIRTLQQRHKYLARSASVHSLWATADLSSASDSITGALLKRLLPPDWFEVLDSHRIGKVTLPDGSCIESSTFCTMGIGYTFPLQTLVFLSLLKAIEAYYFPRNDRRTISVYGDDLIYASRMHDFVQFHFQKFGFVLNVDKTFSTGHFRESCGGDYYHGVDVRPVQPRLACALRSPRDFEALHYKLINGILLRFAEQEVGLTLTYLANRLNTFVRRIKLVPTDYPDDSGVKVNGPLSLPEFLGGLLCTKPQHIGHGLFQFPFLVSNPKLRKEVRHDPYLWRSLQGDECDSFYYYHTNRQASANHFPIIGIDAHDHRPLLIWKPDPNATTRTREGRCQRLNAYVASHDISGYSRDRKSVV